MKNNLAINDIIDIIKSSPDNCGWRGIKCAGCRPSSRYPFPATVNIEAHINTWVCPRCGFINLLTWRKILPVYISPDFGVLGNIIIEAYRRLGLDSDLTYYEKYDIIEENKPEVRIKRKYTKHQKENVK